MTRVTLLSPTSGRPTATWRPCRSRVAIGHRVRPVLPSYGHADPGALLAVVNSDGRVEVAARDRSAAERTGAGEVARLDPAAG